MLQDAVGALSLVDTDLSQDDSELSILPANALSFELSNQHELSIPASDTESKNAKKLALMSLNSLDTRAHLNPENFSRPTAPVSDANASGRKVFPLENPKDMIARWELDNLDQRNVVQDALLSGRLPLAVLKLHLHRLQDLIGDKEPHDTFIEVRDIGRAIAYDLFLKVSY